MYQLEDTVLAEQSGSSPESGATSRIKTIYDSLTSLSHGSDLAGGWGNWGALWNRIRSAAEWVPAGDATEADVATGKTFYSSDRAQKTGIAPPAFDCSTQKLATMDDYLGTYKSEESIWSKVSGSSFTGLGAINFVSGTVKQDNSTGLYWSSSSTDTRLNRLVFTDGGIQPTGGNSIAFCDDLKTISFGCHNDWYLPTLKELLMAFIKGVYSQDPISATNNIFWLSTGDSEQLGEAVYATDFRFSQNSLGNQLIS